MAFLRAKEAADVLGLAVGTLANMRYRGVGPVYTRAPNPLCQAGVRHPAVVG